MKHWLRRWLPTSLTGQALLALAAALMLAQAISAVLLYRAQGEYRLANLSHALALRTTMTIRRLAEGSPPRAFHGAHDRSLQPAFEEGGRGPPVETMPSFLPAPGDVVDTEITGRLARMLAEQEITPARLIVVDRPFEADRAGVERFERRYAIMGHHSPPRPAKVMIAAVQMEARGPWMLVRVNVPAKDPWLLTTLIAQTLFIYALLVGAMAVILRRIARPLAALTARVAHFAETREAGGQMAPQGPHDVRHLIEAHNALEQGIIALINEKDVMLGAIGHDLKTPLAALRVRIECVEDDAERGKMAQTIEDIVRSLDDILSLARVGRPSDPLESTELSALVGSIVEEYEDMGDDVTINDTVRLVLPARATWLRRALRNLIGNALRYSGSAAVSLSRETLEGRDWAVIRVSDPGKGIPESEIERMFQPFTRGEPSRNTVTGGAGLGLTLARAIADQHGGRLLLANRLGDGGAVVGLMATLWLPLPR